jgi:hypothetical protein
MEIMTIGFLFYLLMLLWLVFGLYWNWPNQPGPAGFGVLGGNLLLFVLLLLLGIACFGWPIKG